MKNILSAAGDKVLRKFAQSRVLLAFDYDGTLAPITERPDDARMRPETRALLWELTRLSPVIVISGRSQPDALRRLQGAGVLEVVGNHGIEPWHAANRYIGDVQRWLPILRKHLAGFDGLLVEDKIYSVAVHYRSSPRKKEALARILAAAGSLGALRIIRGKQVVNLLSEGAPDKGKALERERERLGCERAIYVGDDETDEDVFELDHPARLLGIRVGARASSAAPWYLDSQRRIDALLRKILQHRQGSKRAPRVAP